MSQIDEDDHYMYFHALDIITDFGESIDDRMRVFSFLEHSNPKFRSSAMHIISNFLNRNERIHEACSYLANKKIYSDSYEKGLLSLLDIDNLTSSEITQMIDSDDAIIRKYGIIAACKLYDKYPHITNEAVNNEDLDVREYSKTTIKAKSKFDQMMREINAKRRNRLEEC